MGMWFGNIYIDNFIFVIFTSRQSIRNIIFQNNLFRKKL